MKSRKGIKNLRERWQGIGYKDLKKLLYSPEKMPFGCTKDNYVDFRGVEIAIALYQMKISNVDFSYSIMGVNGQLGGAIELNGCKFDYCKYESALDGVFNNCSFIRAKLNESTIREKFYNCYFTKTNFSGVRGRGVLFERCEFTDANFRKASYYDSKFLNCCFNNCNFVDGSLAGSAFTNCELKNIEFKNTILERVKGI